MNQVSNANVIREMIRHEDDLLIGRTNWLMTLQGLLFAALAFAWEIPWVPYLIMLFGVLFALLFYPYLRLSELAIAKLLNWWTANNSGYDGPPVIGLGYEEIPARYSKILPWLWFPYVFSAAWLLLFVVKLTQ